MKVCEGLSILLIINSQETEKLQVFLSESYMGLAEFVELCISLCLYFTVIFYCCELKLFLFLALTLNISSDHQFVV